MRKASASRRCRAGDVLMGGGEGGVAVVLPGDDQSDRDQQCDEHDGETAGHPSPRSLAHGANLAQRSVGVRLIRASLDCVVVGRRIDQVTAHPSAMLLGAQLLQVLAWPFLGGSKVGGAFLGVIAMLAVGSAVLAVRRTPHVSRVVFFLGAPTIVFTLLEAIFPTTEPIVLVSALLHAPFYFYVSYAMLRYLFHDDVITTDEYFATGAAFTVVAWGFAYVFVVVQIMWPDSFVNAEATADRASSCSTCRSPR